MKYGLKLNVTYLYYLIIIMNGIYSLGVSYILKLK